MSTPVRCLLLDLTSLDLAMLKREQEKSKGERPAGLCRNKQGVWADKHGVRWVPDTAVGLQLLMYAAAHQGISGHRGKQATIKRLKRHVKWSTLSQDVNRWQDNCLRCIKLRDGSSVPRPLPG